MQAEWAAGNQLAAEVEREETLIVDPVVTEYLNRLEQSIVRNSGLNGCFLVKLL
jgi:predicted Zn-dependent protease